MAYTSEAEIISKVLSVLKSTDRIRLRYNAKIIMLEERKQRAEQNLYRMGVIGVTSSGKSTLINSLLQEDLLPSAVIPSSSQLVSCRRGNVRTGVVYFENKQSQSIQSSKLTPEIIKKYGEEQSNPRNRENVKQIEIVSPQFPLDKNLVLVDSPGLDAYGFEGHEQLTLNTLLPSVDFCLFITTCKTNSDSKSKSVLNTIAQYNKPVIIIQNMIDSIKPSLEIDGSIRKNEKEVAEEHKIRIQKIVEESLLKSTVIILQFSAIWARQSQLKNDSVLLEKSGYENLVSSIKSVYNQLRPNAEINRLQLLKKDIEKVILEAERDGSNSNTPLAKFEFDDVISNLNLLLNQALNKIEFHLKILTNAAETVQSKYSISDSDINEAKRICSNCTSSASNIQTGLYREIKRISEKINIPVTQLFDEQSYFPAMSIPSVQHDTKTRIEWKAKKGFGNGIKRGFGWLFGEKEWGREKTYITDHIVNVQASKDSIVRYLNGAFNSYSNIISKWNTNVNKAIRRIETEIEKHRAEYRARIEKGLESRAYLDVACKLKEIVKTIPHNNIQNPQQRIKCSIYEKQLPSRNIPILSYNISKLAFVINDKIHKLIFDKAVSQEGKPDNIIIGWDLSCLQVFFKRNIGKNISCQSKNVFTIGNNKFQVIYNATNKDVKLQSSTFYKNVFVLVSALQYGQALSQIDKLDLAKFVRKSDNLYLVVQDFHEIQNAQVINEALSSLKFIDKKLNLPSKPTIMLLHENPIFNLSAIETQNKKKQGVTIVQKDELTILSSLQNSSFGFLCRSPIDLNNVITIIKSLK